MCVHISKVHIFPGHSCHKTHLWSELPYFSVAYKRFADNIPLAIDHELVRGIARDVLFALNSGLGIHGPDGLRICQELAAEKPDIANRREELRKRLERLTDANHELMKFGL
jgi:hypothetical protein